MRFDLYWPIRSWKGRSLCPRDIPTGPTISWRCIWTSGSRKVWWPSQVSGFSRQHPWSCQAKDLCRFGLNSTPPPPHPPVFPPLLTISPSLDSSGVFPVISSINNGCYAVFAIMLSDFHHIFKKAPKTSKKEPELQAGWDQRKHFINYETRPQRSFA